MKLFEFFPRGARQSQAFGGIGGFTPITNALWRLDELEGYLMLESIQIFSRMDDDNKAIFATWQGSLDLSGLGWEYDVNEFLWKFRL